MEVAIVVMAELLTGVLAASFFFQHALAKRRETPLQVTGQGRYKRNTTTLLTLIFVAIVYSGLLGILRTLTGITMLDGGIGVALGLYICAHPAANAVNMLFFERDMLRQGSEWSVVQWLALNLLVLLVGWVVIFVGLTRLVGRAA